jgi:hypothetical protein
VDGLEGRGQAVVRYLISSFSMLTTLASASFLRRHMAWGEITGYLFLSYLPLLQKITQALAPPIGWPQSCLSDDLSITGARSSQMAPEKLHPSLISIS